MKVFSALNREQKEAVALLQIGTFLEYFDLMLYVHMAVLLNDLFFPKTDPHTSALLAAFAFCSTYILRPFGALIFGYIGDHIGRKSTVVITTFCMSISCIIMATLPTYAQIWFLSAWVVTACRVLQGLSSMVEIIGAEIYLTELTQPPARNFIVSLIGCSARLGTMVALGISTLVINFSFDWRNAFWIGAIIALIGSVARSRLRETSEFVNMKVKMKRAIDNCKDENLDKAALFKVALKKATQEKFSLKTNIAFFLISSGPPVCLYFSYIYCGDVLKSLGQLPEDVIRSNFLISIAEFAGILVTAFLSLKYSPFRILKYKSTCFLIFVLFLPFALIHESQPYMVIGVQLISVILTLTGVPAVAAIIIHFPVFRRFTYTSFVYALSRSLMYVVTSFGLVFLTEALGHYGVWFILLPITIGFHWGIRHFEALSREMEDPRPINQEVSTTFSPKGLVAGTT